MLRITQCGQQTAEYQLVTAENGKATAKQWQSYGKAERRLPYIDLRGTYTERKPPQVAQQNHAEDTPEWWAAYEAEMRRPILHKDGKRVVSL